MKNINIRFVDATDAAALAAIYAPYVEETPVSFEYLAPDWQEFERRIGEISAFYPYLVCEIDGKIAGYAYANIHLTRAAYQWDMMTSVYIAKDFHRRHIATALYHCLFEILKKQGFYTAYASITLPNIKSTQLHKSLGFTEIGVFHKTGYKMGAWHDVIYLEKHLTEHFGTPAPARAVNTLAETDISVIFKDAIKMIRP